MSDKELNLNIGYNEGVRDAYEVVMKAQKKVVLTPEVEEFCDVISKMMFKLGLDANDKCKEMATTNNFNQL